MPTVKRVVLVGHCGPDNWLLRDAVRRIMGALPVELAGDDAQADRLAGPDALFLVNRDLDGHFAEPEGVALIRALAQRPAPPVLMLISNFPHAQQDAQRAGARPGFGKAQLGDPQTVATLRGLAQDKS